MLRDGIKEDESIIISEKSGDNKSIKSLRPFESRKEFKPLEDIKPKKEGVKKD